MKTKRFRLLTVLLTAVMLVALSLNVLAAKSNAVTKDGLTAQLFTDKDSYKAGESVKASVQVDNHTGREVFIFAQINAPEGVKLASESAAFDTRLQDGETWITPGGVSLVASNATAGAAATGDNMQAGFWIVLTVLAVAGIIALFVYGKNKKTWLSIMLCMAMVAGMVVTAVPAYAADMNGDIELSCTIQVDGKDTELSATVSYVIYDDAAEEADEPVATTVPTEAPATEAPATEAPTATVTPSEPSVTEEPTEAPTTAPTTPTSTPSAETTPTPTPSAETTPTPTPSAETTPTPTPTPTTEPTPEPTPIPDVEEDPLWYNSRIYMTSGEQAQVDAIIADVLVMHKGSLKAYKDGELVEMSVAPVEVDMEMFVPLAFVAEMFETELNVTPNGDTVREIDGTVYVKAAYAAELLSKPYFVHNGLVVIGKDNTSFAAADARVQDEVIRMVRYQRVTRTNIYNDLIENLDEKQHPRVYATADDFARIRAAIETDDFVKKSYENLKKQADTLLGTDPIDKTTVDITTANNNFSKISPERIKILSFVYQITKDEKYAERAWDELEAVCTAGKWPTVHFLSIGEIMSGVSVGFDWLYDYLDDNQKELIKTKLYTDGIYEAYLTYIGTPTNTTHGWTETPKNWNANINRANLASLIAVCDEEFSNNELSNVIIPSFEMALRSLEIHFNEWDPDGAWEEGPGYGRATAMFDAEILSLLNTAMGTDYGIADVTNFLGSAYYMLYMQGPAGDYNYGNAEQLTDPANEFGFYYAKEFEDKSIGYERKTAIVDAGYACDELELIWYDPQWIGNKIEGLELDKYFRRSEVVTMRSDWSKDGMFAGFLSGYNARYVSHLDTGNYVLDWAGTRWADDLGTDSLNTNYAGGEIRSYAERAEGHNTLVIDETPYLNEDTESEFVACVEYDFEEYTANTSPQTTDLFKWTVTTSDVSKSVTVIEEANASNKAIQLEHAQMEVYLEEPYPTEEVEISYRFMIKGEGSISSVLLANHVLFNAAGGAVQFKPLAIINDKIQYQDYSTGSGWKDITVDGNALTATRNQWYDISIKMDIKQGTYSLNINGTELKDLGMLSGGVEFKYIVFNYNSVDGQVLLDDIAVKIPSKLITRAEYDFEEYTANTSPQATDLFKWTVTTSDVSKSVTVIEEANASNKAIQLEHAQMEVYLEEPYPTEEVEISYRFMIKGEGDISSVLLANHVLFNAAGGAVQFKPLVIRGNKIQYYDPDHSNGANWYDITVDGNALTATRNQWYDISIKMDIKQGTYSLNINGTELKDLGMLSGGVEFKYIVFNYNSVDGQVLLDDIAIKATPNKTQNIVQRGDDQVLFSDCVITKYESKPYGSLAITDMTNAYEPWVTSAQRGVMLTNNRSVFIVRDEVALKAKSDVYWFAHYEYKNTAGAAYVTTEVSADGKSAIMTDRSGNRMWVGIIDGEGKFEIKDCSFLPGSPELTEADKAKTKDYSLTHKKLTIKYQGVTEVAVTVAYIPLSRNLSVVAPEELPNVGELKDWTIPVGEVPSLDTLTLGGVEIEGFEPTKTNYTITVTPEEGIPTVAATSSNGTVSAITQATTECPVASFTVTKADGTSTKFVINFYVRNVLKKQVQGYWITEDDITTNHIKQPEHPPKNVLDGKLNTRWTSEGTGQWIQLDFGELKSFSKLDIAMYNSAARTYLLEIYVSQTGEDWTLVYSGEDKDVYQDGTHMGAVSYDFGGEYQAQYIKIVLNGYKEATTDIWNNIAEIE